MNNLPDHSEYQPEFDLPVVTSFRHNLWANKILFESCAGLDEEQLAAEAVGTYGSIYQTFRHLAASQQGYLNLLSLKKQGRSLGWAEWPDMDTLKDYARKSGLGLIEAAGQTKPDEVVPIKYPDGRLFPIPAGLILIQAITHAVEHRTHISTIMTQLGLEPPDTSAWQFVEHHITPVESDEH